MTGNTAKPSNNYINNFLKVLTSVSSDQAGPAEKKQRVVYRRSSFGVFVL